LSAFVGEPFNPGLAAAAVQPSLRRQTAAASKT